MGDNQKYAVYGLCVTSAVELFPGMNNKVDCKDENKSLKVDFGIINKAPSHNVKDGVWYWHESKMEFVSFWQGVGNIAVLQGKSVVVDPEKGFSLDLLRLPLAGTALSIALWQRGLTVLHGSCVEIEGDAILLLGEKGQGKSTLAAWLSKSGHSFLSDDVCALECIAEELYVHPSFPQVKLYPDVIKMIGLAPDKYDRVHPLMEKRRVNLTLIPKQTPVKGVYVLAVGDELNLRPLSGLEAIQQIMRHLMINRFPEGQPPEMMKQILEQAIEVVKKLPVYRLTRPKDLSFLRKTQELIEASLRCEV